VTAVAQIEPRVSLHDLAALGQSVWIDFLSRDLVRTGGLHRLISTGVSGVTTNPTILQQAVAGSRAYDRQLRDLAATGADAETALFQIAATDVAAACDALADVWRESAGRDGFVSWEVDPALADSPKETVAEAHALVCRVGRPNLLVKIPATRAGVAAFEEATAAGLSVNVTLIFTLARYGEVLSAYSRGLSRAAAAGLDLTAIHSVASFFVSRLDVAADRLLDKIGTPTARALRGRLGIASAKLAYRLFQRAQATERWEHLRASGAEPQRCLWASTATKNHAYRDVMYVEELVGRSTVTTLPSATLDAFLDHGRAAPTLTQGVEEAAGHMLQLAAAGVDVDAIGRELERDGVERFRRSQREAVDSVAATIASPKS
jgi:transaldolase